jgi:hydrogenase maturation protein HypF
MRSQADTLSKIRPNKAWHGFWCLENPTIVLQQGRTYNLNSSNVMAAVSIHIRGIVQGVGFRPFVYRLAAERGVHGWVKNTAKGVEIHAEAEIAELGAFVEQLAAQAPDAAVVAHTQVDAAIEHGYEQFAIIASSHDTAKEAGISPDLAVCKDCLHELFDPANPRYGYPYISCTHCGPRYSIVLALPYDRPTTTMHKWELCLHCAQEYHEPINRRFHAQPVACVSCGPEYVLFQKNSEHQNEDGNEHGNKDGNEDGNEHRSTDSSAHRYYRQTSRSREALRQTAELLSGGAIVGIKGIGGYHLACDASNEAAVRALRERKFRKDKPFAVMVETLAEAARYAYISDEEAALLTSSARPIVLLQQKTTPNDAPILPFELLAPNSTTLGVMLAYTPLHILLFKELQRLQASTVLVMTSANRSSEPIAYRDDEALERLQGIADALLVGERPIARRVEDSVVRSLPSQIGSGTMMMRRSRGYAPSAVAHLPERSDGAAILALGADLKNSLTMVVDSQAFVSQYIGDLEEADAVQAFHETMNDFLNLYGLHTDDMVIVHDAHPGYVSTRIAQELPCKTRYAVQHHKAHIASVLAEHLDDAHAAHALRVVGVAFDGTGWGDDGTIWGGEVFVGSAAEGFERVGGFTPVRLAGGDAAAKHPVQAAAGFLEHLHEHYDVSAEPFCFPAVYAAAQKLLASNVRVMPSSSAGRLFDAVAALLGFTRPVTFEGQAAMWLEHQAKRYQQSRRTHADHTLSYTLTLLDGRWDAVHLVEQIVHDVRSGRDRSEIAYHFHRTLAQAIVELSTLVARERHLETVVLSGGVFQNMLLLTEVLERFRRQSPHLRCLVNSRVPTNDGGISLGQALLASVAEKSVCG